MKVLVALLVALDVEAQWRKLPPDCQPIFCGYDEDSIHRALNPEVEILVTDVLPTDLEKCKGLRWIQLVSAGADQLANHPILNLEILLSNAAGIFSVHMAEFVVSQILRQIKKLDVFRELQRSHQWPNRAALAEPCLRGKHALIIGYGGVGRETARLLSAFGMKIMAVLPDPSRRSYNGYLPYPNTGDPEGIIPEQIVSPAELSAVLPNADFVILSVSLEPSTYRMINAATLEVTKPSAVLINISRGAVVDSEALVAALDKRTLEHAYLDVFDEEPLPLHSPLWDHPKITVTPHMAGVTPQDDLTRWQDLFLANFERFKKGQPLINQLDRHRLIKMSQWERGKYQWRKPVP